MRPGSSFLPGNIEKTGEKLQVLEYGEVRIEIVFLLTHAYSRSYLPPFGIYVQTENLQPAGSHRGKAIHHPYRRRLACAVWAEQTNALAGRQVKRYPVNRRKGAEILSQVNGTDYVSGGLSHLSPTGSIRTIVTECTAPYRRRIWRPNRINRQPVKLKSFISGIPFHAVEGQLPPRKEDPTRRRIASPVIEPYCLLISRVSVQSNACIPSLFCVLSAKSIMIEAKPRPCRWGATQSR